MTFMVLGKVVPGKAEQVFKYIREGGLRREAEEAAKIGIKFLGTYFAYGRFDFVLIFEAPDLATANQALTSIATHGFASTETLVLQSPEEFVKTYSA